MEVAVLTARLEAITSGFLASMRVAQTETKSMQDSIKSLERAAYAAKNELKGVALDETKSARTRQQAKQMQDAVDGVYRSALAADDALAQMDFSDSQVARFVAQAEVYKKELRDIKQEAEEARVAMATLNPGSSSAMARSAAIGNSAELQRLRSRQLRMQMETAQAAAEVEQARRNASGILADRASEANARQLERLRTSMLRQQFENAAPRGSMFGTTGTTRRVFDDFGLGQRGAAEHYLSRLGINPADIDAEGMGGPRRGSRVLGDVGGFFSGRESGRRGGVGGFFSDLYTGRYGGRSRGLYDVPGFNFLAGVLPGGRRARPAAVLSGIGLGLAATPALGAGAIGVGAGLAAGAGVLVGTIGTLGLAFADLTKDAFTTQKAFNALTPVQQKFVQNLREIDAGFLKPLEDLAQKQVLPKLTQAVNSVLNPQSIGVVRNAVGSFGNAIGGGAMQFGKLLGSSSFLNQLGPVLQADARYTRDLFDGLAHLADAFVRVLNAARPLTDWLDQKLLSLAKWADNSVIAAQKSGRLTHAFDDMKEALQALGRFVDSVLGTLKALLGGVGFRNSVDTVNLLASAFNLLGKFIHDNQDIISGFLAGLIQALNDVLAVLGPITSAITKFMQALRSLIKPLSDATDGIIGVRGAIDALLAVMTIKWISGWGKAAAAAEAAGATITTTAGAMTLASTEALTLQSRLLKLAALRIVIPVAIFFSVKGITEKLWHKLIGGADLGSFPDFSDNTETKMPNYSKVTVGGVTYPKGSGEYDVYRAGFIGAAPPFGVPATDPVYSAGFHAGQTARATAAIKAGKGAVFGGDTIAGFNPTGINTGHAKPNPLQGTGKTGVLPTSLENAILQAQFSGSIPAQRSAIQNALSWLNSHMSGVKNATTRTTWLQEGISLKSQLDSLGGSASTRFGGTTSAGGAVFNAQQALKQAMTTGSGVSFSKQIELAKKFHDLAASAYDKLRGQAVAASEIAAKQATLNRLKRDEVQATRDVTIIEERRRKSLVQTAIDAAIQAKANYTLAVQEGATHQQQIKAATKYLQILEKQEEVLKAQGATQAQIEKLNTAERKAQHDVATNIFQSRWEHMLGIGDGTGASALSIQRRVRNTLLHMVRGLSTSVRTAAGAVKSKDPFAAIPGAPGMSTDQLIKSLQAHGVHFSQRALDDFSSIEKILSESKMNHIKLNSTISEKITALLQQIEQNTNPKNTALPTYHLASLKDNMRMLEKQGIGHRKARGLATQMLEAEIYGGHLPSVGGAVAGIAVRNGGHNMHVNTGDTTIIIQGYEKDPKVLAAEIRNAMLKTKRRNTTQTRGPQAGKNLGMT